MAQIYRSQSPGSEGFSNLVHGSTSTIKYAGIGAEILKLPGVEGATSTEISCETPIQGIVLVFKLQASKSL